MKHLLPSLPFLFFLAVVALLGHAQVAHAAGECVNSAGNIQPESIAPCLDPKNSNFPFIIETWRWSLSLVNVFAALILIFMAFANILYPLKFLEPYRIKQLLPNFIGGVILANLSLFICRALVSAADLLMNQGGLKVSLDNLFVTWGINPKGLEQGIIQAFPKMQYDPARGIGVMIYQLLVATVLVYGPIIALAVLAFIFYLRFAVIFIAAAISPLAFGALIFPATQEYLNKWWDLFWKWTYGGVGSYLILRLAAQINPAKGGGFANGGNTVIDLIPYMIALALVYIAAITPFKLGGALGTMWGGLGKWGLRTGLKTGGFATRRGMEGIAKWRNNSWADIKLADMHPLQRYTYGWIGKGIGMAAKYGPGGIAATGLAIPEAFKARGELHKKQLRKAVHGTWAFERGAGLESAILARDEDFTFLKTHDDASYLQKKLADIKFFKGTNRPRLSNDQMIEFSRSPRGKQAELAKKWGLSVDQALTLRNAMPGLQRLANLQRVGANQRLIDSLNAVPLPFGIANPPAPGAPVPPPSPTPTPGSQSPPVPPTSANPTRPTPAPTTFTPGAAAPGAAPAAAQAAVTASQLQQAKQQQAATLATPGLVPHGLPAGRAPMTMAPSAGPHPSAQVHGIGQPIATVSQLVGQNVGVQIAGGPGTHLAAGPLTIQASRLNITGPVGTSPAAAAPVGTPVASSSSSPASSYQPPAPVSAPPPKIELLRPTPPPAPQPRPAIVEQVRTITGQPLTPPSANPVTSPASSYQPPAPTPPSSPSSSLESDTKAAADRIVEAIQTQASNQPAETLTAEAIQQSVQQGIESGTASVVSGLGDVQRTLAQGQGQTLKALRGQRQALGQVSNLESQTLRTLKSNLPSAPQTPPAAAPAPNYQPQAPESSSSTSIPPGPPPLQQPQES